MKVNKSHGVDVYRSNLKKLYKLRCGFNETIENAVKKYEQELEEYFRRSSFTNDENDTEIVDKYLEFKRIKYAFVHTVNIDVYPSIIIYCL